MNRRSLWAASAAIFILALGIRVFFLSKIPQQYVVPHTQWEMQAVAYSLAERCEFADPYVLPTGPTAHLPPVMPVLTALIWKLFGMGLVAGYAAFLFRMATYAALYSMLPRLAGRLGVGHGAGVLAGVVGALWALWPGHGEALTGIALALLLVAFLRRWTVGLGPPIWSLVLGLAAGAAFHLQPALLPVVLGCLAFELWWSPNRQKWARSAVLVAGMVLACIPWGWRNYATFHEVFFIRSNIGLELRMGNHEGAAAAMDVMDAREEFLHPRTHVSEARLVQELGEVPYMRRAGREAFTWIAKHPGSFAQLTAERVLLFWAGPLYDPVLGLSTILLTLLAVLGAIRILPALAAPQRAALLIPLVTYPLIYYVVAYMPRYRVPVLQRRP
jgi:4-amino-4-deoxy-L-arabinose transferase-like glycosyltransferase